MERDDKGCYGAVIGAEAIEERLVKDGERSMAKSKSSNPNKEKLRLLVQMDKLRQEIGSVGSPTSEPVEEGRRR